MDIVAYWIHPFHKVYSEDVDFQCSHNDAFCIIRNHRGDTFNAPKELYPKFKPMTEKELKRCEGTDVLIVGFADEMQND